MANYYDSIENGGIGRSGGHHDNYHYSGSRHYDSTGNRHYHNSPNNGFYDEMTNPVTNCSRFERRHDFSTFNMSDYMACENCRHLSAENKCIAGKVAGIGRME